MNQEETAMTLEIKNEKLKMWKEKTGIFFNFAFLIFNLQSLNTEYLSSNK